MNVGAADQTLLVIAEWDRNARERIRVTLDRYHGNDIVSVRTFYRDAAGELKPGRSGIAMGVRHLPALAEAVNAALAKARELGLIEPATKEGQAS